MFSVSQVGATEFENGLCIVKYATIFKIVDSFLFLFLLFLS